MTTRARRSLGDDCGSGYMAAFIVLFSMLTFGGVAVVADSGRIVSSERNASAAAFESARAGAQAIDDTTIRTSANASIDPAEAAARARSAAAELLIGSSASVSSVTVDGDQVVVTITDRVDRWFPGLADIEITETGRARLAVGITQEGQ
jgi:hypothetical protein